VKRIGAGQPAFRTMRNMNIKTCDQHDPLARTAVLPPDEVAIQRERKRLGHLTPSQIERLIVAAELRRRATEGEGDD
jgi:hypothetical protein